MGIESANQPEYMGGRFFHLVVSAIQKLRISENQATATGRFTTPILQFSTERFQRTNPFPILVP